MIDDCRHVLKNLQKLSQSTDTELCFIVCHPHICRSDCLDVYYDYSDQAHQIHAVIDQLALDGYIRYSDLGKDYFFLTYKGVHPYKVEWQRIKNFLFTSIFIPIVVSFATTVLTLFVQSLLQ